MVDDLDKGECLQEVEGGDSSAASFVLAVNDLACRAHQILTANGMCEAHLGH